MQTNILLKYTDGTPVTYQFWNNYLIKNKKFKIKVKKRKKFYKKYLEKIKIAQKKLQPDLQYGSNNCVLMITAVLAETDWITVPCYEENSHLIICQSKLDHTDNKGDMIHNNCTKAIWCAEGQLFIENKCIQFTKYKRLTNINIAHHKTYGAEFTKIDFNQSGNINITEYFSLIQHYADQPLQFTLGVAPDEQFLTYTAVQSSTYEKLTWIGRISNATQSQYDGYFLFPVPYSQIKFKAGLFHCSDGSYIDETLICDGIKDCSEGIDEKNCVCNDNSSELFFSVCKYRFYSSSKMFTCSEFFFQCSSFPFCVPYLFICNGYKDCQQGEDEFCSDITSNIKNSSLCVPTNETFKHFMSRKFISVSFVGDLVPEFPTSFEDQAPDYNLLTSSYYSAIPCANSNELPCVAGHTYRFPISKLCVYDFDHLSLQLRYWRNGAHLHNCTHF